jgi:hypothetical protein
MSRFNTYLEAVKDVEGLGFTVFRSEDHWFLGHVMAVYDDGSMDHMGDITVINSVNGSEHDNSFSELIWL